MESLGGTTTVAHHAMKNLNFHRRIKRLTVCDAL
jgi:hypothetical protein